MGRDWLLDTAEEAMRAEQYRLRAEKLRVVAEWIRDPHARNQVMQTAREYDQMAQSAQRVGLYRTSRRILYETKPTRPRGAG